MEVHHQVWNEFKKGYLAMPLKYTEADLQAVGKIQEKRGCTIAHAKDVYRKYVLKLANPDIENRAELVLASMDRGVQVATDEEAEAAAPKARKAPKAKKEPKPKKAAPTPRIEMPLPQLSREVVLSTTPTPHVYTANLFGKKHAVLWAELDHAGQGAKSRFGPVGLSSRRLDLVKGFADANQLPTAVCVTVRVGGRLDQGYAVSFDVYRGCATPSGAFNVNAAARKTYADAGWDGCKFIEKVVEEKAA